MSFKLFKFMSLISKQTQRGSILIFSILVLTVVLVISFSLVAVFLPKIRVSREATNSVTAIYAADSIIEWCLYENRIPGDVNPPTMSNGATYVLGNFPGSKVPPFGTDICPLDDVLDRTAVGTFNGVSRAFDIGQVN